MYHELGHFVDTTLGISDYSMLVRPPGPADPKDERSHRKEHFADLFACCYVGGANSAILQEIAGKAGACSSHPATQKRGDICKDFLDGRRNPTVELFQNTLKTRRAPGLSMRYSKPNLAECFDDMRPFPIRDVPQLHGMFEAGWDYLGNALRGKAQPWSGMEADGIQKTINDLVEKSIRNMSVIENWRYGAAS